MASFTDQLVGFNPYIPQIPVDDYVRVGMIKQQQYNEGVQKVQTYIDSVAGLDVIKPEQKEYLQQRVGQLQGEVSKVLSQDFSNQQLVNSVGTLTNKIAGDPIVQNSVLSTQRYKAGLAAMKTAQEEGKNSPSNEYVFQQQVQKWLGDGDVKSTFNGEYEKYTDTKKPILEAINALKPGANITDIPYETDQAGNLVLDKRGNRQIAYATLREKLEGVSEDRVKMAIEASITPQMKRQFEIDGQYEYRGVDKVGLKRITDASYNNRLQKVNDIIQGLTTQFNSSQDNDAQKAAIQRQIDNYKLNAKDLIGQYRNDVDNLDKNSDYYKGALHIADEISKYTLGYSWSKHSLTYEKNPIFEGVMKEKEHELNWQKLQETMRFHAGELAIKEREANIKEEIFKIKYGAQAGGGGGNQFQLDRPTLGPIDQEKLESVNLSTITGEIDTMTKDIDQQKMKMIGQLPGGEAWVENRDGQLIYKSPEAKAAAESAVKQMKESYDKDPSKVSPAAQTFFKNYSIADGTIKDFQATADKIVKEADTKYNVAPLLKSVSPLHMETAGGGNYNFTPEELADLATRYKTLIATKAKSPAYTGAPVPASISIPDADMNQFMGSLSPKERALISIYNKQDNLGRPTGNQQDATIRSRFDHVLGVLGSGPAQQLQSDRTNFIQQEARRAYTQQQQQTNPIIAYKGADQARAKDNFVQLLNDQKAAGKANTNPLFDEGQISTMLDNKNFKNTAYSLHTNPDGSYSVRFSNTSVTDKPREMDITPQQAEIWFGSFVNEFKPLQQAINLSKYKGTGATTDVRGLGKESAYNIPETANLQNYSVKYHVEEPFDGQYQIKLYIYDKKGKQWLPETYVDVGGRMLSPRQVTTAIANLSDSEIDRIKGKKTTRPVAPASYGGIPGPDPYVDKQGISAGSDESEQETQPATDEEE